MTDDKVKPIGTGYSPEPRPASEYEDLKELIEVLADEITHLSRTVQALTRALKRDKERSK